MSESHDELDYAGGGLPQETNWWGAFVIGLAGTILVTGIAPVMVTYVGAASIPSIVIITLTGWLLCLFLAELSAMMPERTGGSPSYAYPAFKTRWPRFAEHLNGFTTPSVEYQTPDGYPRSPMRCLCRMPTVRTPTGAEASLDT